jgi:hypothetical protein
MTFFKNKKNNNEHSTKKIVFSSYQILEGVTNGVWAGSNDTQRQMRTIDNTSGTSCIVLASTDIYGGANQEIGRAHV